MFKVRVKEAERDREARPLAPTLRAVGAGGTEYLQRELCCGL